MAIKNSGTFLRFSEIASEFGDSQPHSMSEFTRGGVLVPDSASNALIRSVAQRAAGGANGRMKWSDFYGAANGFGLTIATTVTNVDLATLFNTAQAGIWASSDLKILTIDSGVTVGATSTGNAALTIPSGMGGTLAIVNNGTIVGKGGAGGTSGAGSTGGNAIQVLSSGVTLTNNGFIYAGGGGGGQGGTGGTGGNGSYTTTTTVNRGDSGCVSGIFSPCDGSCQITFGSTAYCINGNTQCQGGCNGLYTGRCFQCLQPTTTTASSTGASGGAGGAGGAGAGYLQATGVVGTNPAPNGNPGSNNAGDGGSGGTGGTGGAYGTAGNQGLQGIIGGNGNVGGGYQGSAGSAGGAAGYSITGYNNVTLFTDNGTTAGATNP